MDSTKHLENKLRDYRRFTMTLLILSSYLYIGVIISLYEYQTNAYYYLFAVIAVLLGTSAIFINKIKHWQQKLREE
ncbi:YrhC family protein [Halobacillus sp. A5]|uniref:YrhC family protein n=1 Tax=Halobacillus sp. A5 TaxID=2880263 RepID=UPI0020A6BF0A|nr:YrhC family protein [Halobacillus sp. A5]MCP3025597.1 YrhC family protein [Halobacillus sp. A5]